MGNTLDFTHLSSRRKRGMILSKSSSWETEEMYKLERHISLHLKSHRPTQVWPRETLQKLNVWIVELGDLNITTGIFLAWGFWSWETEQSFYWWLTEDKGWWRKHGKNRGVPDGQMDIAASGWGWALWKWVESGLRGIIESQINRIALMSKTWAVWKSMEIFEELLPKIHEKDTFKWTLQNRIGSQPLYLRGVFIRRETKKIWFGVSSSYLLKLNIFTSLHGAKQFLTQYENRVNILFSCSKRLLLRIMCIKVKRRFYIWN